MQELIYSIVRKGQTEQIRIPYEIIRSDRKSLGLSIDPEGNVRVRIPKRVTTQTALDFVKRQQTWILHNYLKQMERADERKRQREECPYTPEELAGAERYFRARAKSYFPSRAAFFAKQMEVTYGTISIRDQKTRWGSRSSTGTLSFNWRLMLAPKEVLDYVVVHELAHIKEMNHSKAFWKEVEKVLPDYEERRKWLKEHGSELTKEEAVRQIYRDN